MHVSSYGGVLLITPLWLGVWKFEGKGPVSIMSLSSNLPKDFLCTFWASEGGCMNIVVTDHQTLAMLRYL